MAPNDALRSTSDGQPPTDHAWIDTLPVPAARRPPPSAPLRVLVAYLVRQRLSRLVAQARMWWPFGWRTVRDTGITVYQEHPSGRRRVRQRHGGYQPIDRRWLDGGDWTPSPSETASHLRAAGAQFAKLAKALNAASVTVGSPESTGRPAPGAFRGRRITTD